MEEIVLSNAFVIERAGGTIIGYNCRVSLNGKTLEVVPAETIVQRVHVNLKTPRHMHVSFTMKVPGAPTSVVLTVVAADGRSRIELDCASIRRP